MRPSTGKMATQTGARIATAGLGALILFLGGFGVWSAHKSEREAAGLQRTQRVSDAYERARNAIDDERLVEHEEALGHGGNFDAARSARLHHRFDRAAAAVVPALADVRRHGRAADRRLAGRLADQQRAYHTAMDRLFGALRHSGGHMSNRGTDGMGMTGADSAISMTSRSAARATARVQSLQMRWVRLQDEIRTRAARHSVASLAKLHSLRASSRGIFTRTLIAFPVALLLLTALAFVLRGYRRRVDEVRQRELDRLARAALTDDLTGIRNHRAFHEDLERELHRVERSDSPLALVLLDMVGLKQVNDGLGHQEGDEQLKALAACMIETMRGSDSVYRVGGDEFALILIGERALGAMRLVQRLQARLSEGYRETGPRVTAGIAQTSGPLTRNELIRRADLALYEAKHSSRALTVYASGLGDTRTGRQPDVTRRLGTIASTLARAVDAKDPGTRSHCETVAELAGLIGAQLGLSAERVEKLRLAALLHDVGKIGIPDSVLQKPGALSDHEFELMKAHARLGYEIFCAAELDEEAVWVLHHHERPDGNGYPSGLSGSEIPLESRIIMVADAFEAMTVDRPYRRAMPEDEALAELRRRTGTHFDADCVRALIAVVADDAWAPDATVMSGTGAGA
jgi:diguanylate cyclase (GGDEF)-like protein/putative nucleotidyltransferase with HDIG domain